VGDFNVSKSLRSLLLYLVLVGLPLAGVSGVLYAGKRLEAPASVRGRWQLEAAATTSGSNTCGALLEAGQVLNIAQSGQALQLAWGDAAGTTLAGQLDGLKITAHETKGPALLTAVLNQPQAGDRLDGTLTSAECAEPLRWSAVRLPQAE
jgi:hypothetical protein